MLTLQTHCFAWHLLERVMGGCSPAVTGCGCGPAVTGCGCGPAVTGCGCGPAVTGHMALH